MARGLVGSRREVALVLQRGEVRVDGGARRQPDRLADLADARRVAAPADLGVDELEDLALAGGQIGHVGTVARSCVRGKHLFEDFLDAERAFVRRSERQFGHRTGPRRIDGPERGPE